MSGIFAPGLQLKDRVIVRKIRELPIPGEILVERGAAVAPETIVARASLPGELQILRIAETLGITPEEVLTGLKVTQGDRIVEKQLVCEHVGLFGLFKNRYFSPLRGEVELITHETAHVAVRSPARPLELNAYMRGSVVDIVPSRSVTLEAEAAYIQGIFGVGGERSGKIHTLNLDLGEILTPEKLPASLAGAIVIGGTQPSAETLAVAAQRGAVGMVVGALDDRALAAYLGYDLGIAITGDEKVPMSVIVTEGFGDIPMSARLFALMQQCHGKPASMNGATQVRAGAVRPEIIVFHEGAGGAGGVGEVSPATLAIGAKIRIIRVPYFGALGEVVDLPRELQVLGTGAHARVLKARLQSGEVVAVPRANVELI